MAPGIDDTYLEGREPSAAQEGIDSPGPLSSWADLVNWGVYNGGFRIGPPQPASNLDTSDSLASSNFLPGWRFVQSSNTTITAKVVGGVTGSNLRFVFEPGVAYGDEAYVEQIIDIGGSSVGDLGSFLRVSGARLKSSGLNVFVSTQYLASDGTITGMPAEYTRNLALSYNVPSSDDGASDVNAPPKSARYWRIRIGPLPLPVTSSGDALDIYDVRRDRTPVILRLPDSSNTTDGLYDVVQSGSNLWWQPSATTAGYGSLSKRLLNFQLVPLMFSLANIPANAVTDLQLWGDTALGLATPRIGVPWGAMIVGASYRISAVPTAGGANALNIRVQVGGTTVWTPFTLASTGGPPTSSETSLAVPVASNRDLTSGQQIGVVADTSATYTPMSADLAVIVWLAVKFDPPRSAA